MKITGNEPAAPSYALFDKDGELVNVYQEGVTTGRTYGLTKREQFAMAAMQANGDNEDEPIDEIAKRCVALADALIVELNKTTETNAE